VIFWGRIWFFIWGWYFDKRHTYGIWNQLFKYFAPFQSLPRKNWI